MKKIIQIFLILLLTVFLFTMKTGAGDTATQNINITVETINEINISTSDVNLTINAPTAGSQPSEVSDSSTTLAYSTNETGQKITAQLDTDLASGLTLFVNATSTSGTSAGDVMLEPLPVNVITGLSNVSESGETITYTLIPDMNAAHTTGTTYIVTYTITSS